MPVQENHSVVKFLIAVNFKTGLPAESFVHIAHGETQRKEKNAGIGSPFQSSS